MFRLGRDSSSCRRLLRQVSLLNELSVVYAAGCECKAV